MIRRRRRLLAAGPPPDEIWTRAVDRYERGVARFFEKVSFMHDRRLRNELRSIGADLDRALADFRAAGAERRGPPGSDTALVNAIHRAATLCAHATEGAMAAHDAAWRKEAERMSDHLDAVRILVKGIAELADACRLRR